MDHFVRALSHDMTADFLLIDYSFSRLKRRIESLAAPEALDELAHLEACLRQSRRLLNDLVLLGKTGSVDMQPQQVCIARLVQEVLYEHESTLSEQRVRVTVDDALPDVWCNETRVKQVFANLLRNALRHGCTARQPRIRIDCPQTTGGGERVWLRLADNGRGVPAEWKERIFLPGQRAPGAHTAGTGMGLAMVKRIVEHYGGTIHVEDAPGGGAAFVFSLPRCAAPDAISLPAPHCAHRPSAGG
jgi:signal transduction histidine kinase